MNYNFVSSSKTKELFQAASLCITNVINHSERLNASNINTFAPQGNTADTTFNTTLSKFYNVFDFSKFPNLKIRSAQDLSNLHEKSNKVFINEVKTDGYTCRFTFVQARRRTLTATATTTKLELQDFTKAEIDQYFRPCTLDPGRTQVFTSYHGNGQLRQGILLFQGYYIQSKITRLNQSNHRNQTN